MNKSVIIDSESDSWKRRQERILYLDIHLNSYLHKCLNLHITTSFPSSRSFGLCSQVMSLSSSAISIRQCIVMLLSIMLMSRFFIQVIIDQLNKRLYHLSPGNFIVMAKRSSWFGWIKRLFTCEAKAKAEKVLFVFSLMIPCF